MKISYMNDTNKPETIMFTEKGKPEWDRSYLTVNPQTMETMEINAPKGSHPFIKRWKNLILISYTMVLAALLLPISGYAGTDYSDLTRSMEVKYGLPKGILSAIIQVESAGSPDVVVKNDGISHKNSYGLLQIQYRTAKFMGFKGKSKELLQPEVNLEYGARYLAWILQNVAQNDVGRALVCYNAGPYSKACKGVQRYTSKVLTALMRVQ